MTVSTFGPVVLVSLTSGLIGASRLEMTRYRPADIKLSSDRRRRMR
jgi:hypothetical protein